MWPLIFSTAFAAVREDPDPVDELVDLALSTVLVLLPLLLLLIVLEAAAIALMASSASTIAKSSFHRASATGPHA